MLRDEAIAGRRPIMSKISCGLDEKERSGPSLAETERAEANDPWELLSSLGSASDTTSTSRSPSYGCCVASTVDDPAPPVQRTLRLVDLHKPRLPTDRPRS